jgi:hypothetical protein
VDLESAHGRAFRARLDELVAAGLGVRVARDENRPPGDYPRMPLGTCRESSRYLASIFPELIVVSGSLRWRQNDDRPYWPLLRCAASEAGDRP